MLQEKKHNSFLLGPRCCSFIGSQDHQGYYVGHRLTKMVWLESDDVQSTILSNNICIHWRVLTKQKCGRHWVVIFSCFVKVSGGHKISVFQG